MVAVYGLYQRTVKTVVLFSSGHRVGGFPLMFSSVRAKGILFSAYLLWSCLFARVVRSRWRGVSQSPTSFGSFRPCRF